jgi:hypothetical protein
VCPPAGRAHVQPGWLPWGPETAAIRTEPIRVVGSVNQGLAKPTARKGADSGHHFPRLLQYITGLEGCISWVGSSVRYLQVCGPWGTGGAARRVPGCSDVRCCPPQVSWTAAQLDEPAAAGGLTGRLPPCSLAHCPLAPTSDTQMRCTSGGGNATHADILGGVFPTASFKFSTHHHRAPHAPRRAHNMNTTYYHITPPSQARGPLPRLLRYTGSPGCGHPAFHGVAKTALRPWPRSLSRSPSAPHGQLSPFGG